MDTPLLITAGIVIIAFLIKLLRHAHRQYGKIRPNESVARAFEAFHVDPQLHYYLSGPDLYLNALMGIDKAWNLDSDLWKKKELDALRMKELVQNMQFMAAQTNIPLHGFDILDNREEIIGLWFAVCGCTPIVEIRGEKRVTLSTPPPDTYRQF